jgi:hypothetical protein
MEAIGMTIDTRLRDLESRNPDRRGGVVIVWQDRGETEAAAIERTRAAQAGRGPLNVILVGWRWEDEE